MIAVHSLARHILPVLSAIVVVVLLWELAVRVTGVPEYLIPSPTSVGETGWTDRHTLGNHLWATSAIAVTGFALGTVLGVVLATLLGLSATLRRAAEPVLIASQAIPPVIFAPIFIAVMGFGALPKLMVVTLGAFFPVAVSASSAMRNADSDLVDLMVSMGASRLTVLWRVRLPGSVPGIVAGARVSASYVVFSAIIAEWMGASAGLGVYLQRSQSAYRSDQMFAAVAIIALLGVLLYWLTSLIGDRILTRSRTIHHRKAFQH